MPRVRRLLTAAFLALALTGAADAPAQCLLANPSFELRGASAGTFDGWNQFGVVGASPQATHGREAARVRGPDVGTWAVSAFWQRLDALPGGRWNASVRVWHAGAAPLSGSSRAIVNVEWRDAAGDLIDYESHTAADASTPVDQVHAFSVQSQPAPAGTVATHLLLGVLQGPNDPPPEVFYDQATFDQAGPPTLEERQWFDFPGERSVDFAGRTWRVKGPGFYGPGPGLFCDDVDCTWVDAQGRLHLTLRKIGSAWYSTELALEESLGYGDYVFTTRGRLDDWHPNVVLGLFLWQYQACYEPANAWWNPYNEIDLEFSRWGNPARDVGQFVVQPYDAPGNILGFDETFAEGQLTSHAFRWLPDRIEFRSWRGGPTDETAANLIQAWTYTGPHLPRPEQPRVHVNLWRFGDPPSTDHEVVLDTFTFQPACPDPACATSVEAEPLGSSGVQLSQASPNPFNPRTVIRYAVDHMGEVSLVVYDVAGRRLRTLVRSVMPPGDYAVTWDGRDERGDRLASGVYLYRLSIRGRVETRKLVLLR